jgi:hypothetical protein
MLEYAQARPRVVSPHPRPSKASRIRPNAVARTAAQPNKIGKRAHHILASEVGLGHCQAATVLKEGATWAGKVPRTSI